VIASGGGYAALVPDDEPATQAAFFRRNECLVALAHAVVVIEADYRSGARNAAAQARKLGRSLFAVPFPPWHLMGRGCVAELRGGAAICVGARDVLVELERLGCQLVPLEKKISARRRRPSESNVEPGSGDALSLPGMLCDSRELGPEELVVRALEQGANHSDAIGLAAGLSASQVEQALLTLRLRGVLVCDPSGTVALRKYLD
jgi:DNA processing protein